MITFHNGKIRFKYRVVGIAMDENQILIHRAIEDDYWSLPGGRGELYETSIETLKREMREELETDIEIVRLIWIVENFYEDNNKFNHELAFYYLMRFPVNSNLYHKNDVFIRYDGNTELIFKWYKLDELENIALQPKFLRRSLRNLPGEIKHIVHKDQPPHDAI